MTYNIGITSYMKFAFLLGLLEKLIYFNLLSHPWPKKALQAIERYQRRLYLCCLCLFVLGWFLVLFGFVGFVVCLFHFGFLLPAYQSPGWVAGGCWGGGLVWTRFIYDCSLYQEPA